MMGSTVFVFLLRGFGVAMAALGGIWVARTLGPEKLGISTFVFGLVNLAAVLTSLNQNFNFVRRGKNLPAGFTLDALIGQVFSLRLGLALVLVAAALAAVAVMGVDGTWYLAIFAGLVLVLVQGNDAGWVLQLRNRMPRYFVAISIQSIVTGALCLLFIRPGWPAGSDLALGCVGGIAGFCLAWWWACGGWPPGFQVSIANFLQGFRLMKGGRWLVLMGLGTYVLTSAEMPLIGALASVEDLGVYRTALQLVNVVNPFLPLLFFRLYPQLIELEKSDPGGVLAVQFRALARLAAFGLPLVAGAFVLAPFIYPLIFGNVYAGAATPFAFLFASRIVSVGANIFMWGGFARHLDKQVVLLTLGAAFLSLTMNVLLVPRVGIIGAAVVNCGAQILLLVGYIFVMMRSSQPAGDAPMK